jgi:S-adenosyl methyltransferase
MTDEAGLNAHIAHPARRYNYWLGGKDNFAADRASGDAIEATFPTIRLAALENRRFLQRSVRYLVGEGVRQFLDIGTGLPTAGNTHETAQDIAPDSRIVYVDNDDLVLAHARAMLTSHPRGQTAYIHADLSQPAAILADDTLNATLDLSQPVAVLLVAVLHFLRDDDVARAAVTSLVDAMASGSYLVISHASSQLLPPETATTFATADDVHGGDVTLRPKAKIATFFDGLDLVPPGVQIVSDWRHDPCVTPPPPEQVSIYGAVARKPSTLDGAR